MDLNRVMLIGRLVRDPEVRTTPSGKSVATITIATGRAWTDQAGNKQEKTEFSSCVLWGKLADIAGQYLVKGRQVYIEGRLETRDWVGTDGVKRYRTEIVTESMIMLGSGSGKGAVGSSPIGRPAPEAESESLPTIEQGKDEEIRVEDIPF